MSHNPFGPGLLVCGGYSYRNKKWFFLHEWNENGDEFDSICEIWNPNSSKTKFTEIGHQIDYRKYGTEIESFSRAQAAYASLTYAADEVIFSSGDVDDAGVADVWFLHKYHGKMRATNIGQLSAHIPRWKTWRGNDREGKPLMSNADNAYNNLKSGNNIRDAFFSFD